VEKGEIVAVIGPTVQGRPRFSGSSRASTSGQGKILFKGGHHGAAPPPDFRKGIDSLLSGECIPPDDVFQNVQVAVLSNRDVRTGSFRPARSQV